MKFEFTIINYFDKFFSVGPGFIFFYCFCITNERCFSRYFLQHIGYKKPNTSSAQGQSCWGVVEKQSNSWYTWDSPRSSPLGFIVNAAGGLNPLRKITKKSISPRQKAKNSCQIRFIAPVSNETELTDSHNCFKLLNKKETHPAPTLCKSL